MDVTCYLPDELGRLAKEANLPLSQILRAGVYEALDLEPPPAKPSVNARLAALEYRTVQLDALEARVRALEETTYPNLE